MKHQNTSAGTRLQALQRHDSLGSQGSGGSSTSSAASVRRRRQRFLELDLDSTLDWSELEFDRSKQGWSKGTYGERDVAVKRLTTGSGELDSVPREISTMANVSHPNIVEFVGACCDEDDGAVYIVTEYLPGSVPLSDLVTEEQLDWTDILTVTSDIASAMAYCHDLDIIHRDIRASNMLVQTIQGIRKVKLGDFALARTDASANDTGSNRRLTMLAANHSGSEAPEVIMGMEYGKEADVFSYGILLAELITGNKVGEDDFLMRTMQNQFMIDEDQLRDSTPAQCPELLLDICIECCQFDAFMRPGFQEILERLANLGSMLMPRSPLQQHPAWNMVPFHQLIFGKIVGRGQFGAVYSGHYNGLQVAIKEMLLIDDPHVARFLEREVDILSKINHPNVVQFIGGSQSTGGKLFMVFEFMQGGDLRATLDQDAKDHSLSWSDRIGIALDAAQALEYCHSRDILHRDIKSDNLLVDSVQDTLKTKLCDFGFARQDVEDSAASNRRMTFCGTDEYMAPELIMGEEYGRAADVFSFGVVLAELLTNLPPNSPGLLERLPQNCFEIVDFGPLREAVLPDAPVMFVKLAIMCLQSEVDDRPDMTEIIELLCEARSELESREGDAESHGGSTGEGGQEEGEATMDDTLWQAIQPEELEFDKIVGRGEFGSVYRGHYNGMLVAIKEMLFTHQPEYMKYVEREIAVLSTIGHPNVIQFMGGCRTSSGKYYMVFEFMDGGDLSDLIEDRGDSLSWLDIVRMVVDMSLAIQYCHERNILHRDIKAENMLIEVTNNQRKVKVCDFGLARQQEALGVGAERHKLARRMTMVGTDSYMAPEVIMGEEYGAPADVFSFGMVLAELLAGKMAGNETGYLKRVPMDCFEVDHEEVRANARPGYPPILMDMCLASLNYDADMRPTFDDIVEASKELSAELEAEQALMDMAGNMDVLTGRGSTVTDEVWNSIEYAALEFDKIVGRGSFGSVYRGHYQGMEVAIKELFVDVDTVSMQDLSTGAHTLTELQHRNIVHVLGACRNSAGKHYLITEFMPGGSLAPYTQGKKRLDMLDLLRLSLELCQALEYSHGRPVPVYHGNLQARNILLHRVGSMLAFKVGDFSILPADLIVYMAEDSHKAPESILEGEWSAAGDVYSLGLLLLELIYGRESGVDGFLGRSPRNGYDIEWDDLRDELPEECPELLWDLAVQCCEYDPAYRPTAAELKPAFAKLFERTSEELGGAGTSLSLALSLSASVSSVGGESTESGGDSADATQDKDREGREGTSAGLGVDNLGGTVQVDPSVWTTVSFDDLVFGRIVGKGEFGSVYSGTYRSLDVAIKEMFFIDDPEVMKYVSREIAVMSVVSHPNVVQFLGGATSPEGKLYIVLEFMSGGDLGSLLGEPLSWITRVLLLLDVANALVYCHSVEIIHRDIKPDNVLIEQYANGVYKAKLCDFGLSRREESSRRMTYVGTDAYMAPEIIMDEAYGAHADVFSFGVLMAELLTGKSTADGFLARSPAKLFDIDQEELHEALESAEVPELLRKVCSECLAYEERDRPDAEGMRAQLRAALQAEEEREAASRSEEGDTDSIRGAASDDEDEDGNGGVQKRGTLARSTLMRAMTSLWRFWSAVEFEEVRFGKVIGGGQFGCVYQGEWQREAVEIHEMILDAETDAMGLLTERMIEMQDMTHENVERIVGGSQSPEGLLFVLYEQRAGVHLQEILRNAHYALTWPQRVQIVADVCVALDYLHAHGLTHGQLHSAHVTVRGVEMDGKESDETVSSMLTGLVNGKAATKRTVAGGGVADEEQEGRESARKGGRGKKVQEQVLGMQNQNEYLQELLDESEEGPKGDVFGLGIIAAELISEMPLSAKLLRRTSEGRIVLDADALRERAHDDCPTAFFELCVRCCASQEDVRPDLKEIASELANLDVRESMGREKQLVEEAEQEQREWRGVHESLLQFQLLPPRVVFGKQEQELPVTTGMCYRDGYYVGQLHDVNVWPHGFGEFLMMREGKRLDTETVLSQFGSRFTGFWRDGQRHGIGMLSQMEWADNSNSGSSSNSSGGGVSGGSGGKRTNKGGRRGTGVSGVIVLQVWNRGTLVFEQVVRRTSSKVQGRSSSGLGRMGLFSPSSSSSLSSSGSTTGNGSTSADSEELAEVEAEVRVELMRMEQEMQWDVTGGEGRYMGQLAQGQHGVVRRQGMGAQVWARGQAVFWGVWEADAPVRGWFSFNKGKLFAGTLDALGKFVFGTYVDVSGGVQQAPVLYSGLWSRKEAVAARAGGEKQKKLEDVPVSASVLLLLDKEVAEAREAKQSIEEFYSQLAGKRGRLYRQRNLNSVDDDSGAESGDESSLASGSPRQRGSKGEGSESQGSSSSSSSSPGSSGGEGRMRSGAMLQRSRPIVLSKGMAVVKSEQRQCVHLRMQQVKVDATAEEQLERVAPKMTGHTCMLPMERGSPLLLQLELNGLEGKGRGQRLHQVQSCEQVLLNLRHESVASRMMSMRGGSASRRGSADSGRTNRSPGSMGGVRGSGRRRGLDKLGKDVSSTMRKMIQASEGTWVPLPHSYEVVNNGGAENSLCIDVHLNPYELATTLPALDPFGKMLTQYVHVSLAVLIVLEGQKDASWWVISEDLLLEVKSGGSGGSSVGGSKGSGKRKLFSFGSKKSSGSSGSSESLGVSLGLQRV